MPRSQRIFKKRVNVGKPKTAKTADTSEPIASTSQQSELCDKQQSASKMKLADQLPMYEQFSTSDVPFSYSIVDMNVINELVNEMCCCKVCNKPVKIYAKHVNGLVENIHIQCENCVTDQYKCNSRKFEHKLQDKVVPFYDLNIRLVYGMRGIGRGQQEAKTFCGIMNLSPPPTLYSRHVRLLESAAKKVCEDSMREAIEETVQLNDNIRDIDAAFDGSWQKRGHTSLNGVVTATSVITGKVIDNEILTKFCQCKQRLKNIHDLTCEANYIGTSGGMEIEGVTRIFERSLSTYNVRYKNYLGDGDSKGFKAVCDKKPYGQNFIITKLECLGHVQKRIGTRLRNLKKSTGKTKLSDGKTIGGKGRLTEQLINSIQQYFGQAIRSHTNSEEDMRRAIWAIYYHLSSSNETPLHGLCPKGEFSWCKFQKAKYTNTPYDHERHNHIPVSIMLLMKNIFTDLTKSELLKKCLHNATQNANESVNGVIWKRLPKTTFVWLTSLRFGVYEAIASFNKGNITKCLILDQLTMNVGKNCVQAMKRKDLDRIYKAENSVEQFAKQARKQKLLARKNLEDIFISEEEPDFPAYQTGNY